MFCTMPKNFPTVAADGDCDDVNLYVNDSLEDCNDVSEDDEDRDHDNDGDDKNVTDAVDEDKS